MAKGAYIGVSGKARKIKKIYIGVNGKARKVKKAYIGVNGKARLFYVLGATKVPTYSSTVSGADKVLDSCACGSIGGYAVFAGGWAYPDLNIEDKKWIAYNSSGTKYSGSFSGAAMPMGIADAQGVNNGQYFCVLDFCAPAGWSTGFTYCLNSSLTATYPIDTFSNTEAATFGASIASVNGCLFKYGGGYYDSTGNPTPEGMTPAPINSVYKYDQSFTRSTITVPQVLSSSGGRPGGGVCFDNTYAILIGSKENGRTYTHYQYSNMNPASTDESRRTRMLAINRSFTATKLVCPFYADDYYTVTWPDTGTECYWDHFQGWGAANENYAIFAGYVPDTIKTTNYSEFTVLNKSLTFSEVSFGYIPYNTDPWPTYGNLKSGNMITFGDFFVCQSVFKASNTNSKGILFVNKSLTPTIVQANNNQYGASINIAAADLTLVRMDGTSVRATSSNYSTYSPKCQVEFYKSSG